MRSPSLSEGGLNSSPENTTHLHKIYTAQTPNFPHGRGDHRSSASPSCHSERKAKPVVEPVGRCEASESTRENNGIFTAQTPNLSHGRGDLWSPAQNGEISTAQTINHYHRRGDHRSSVAKRQYFHCLIGQRTLASIPRSFCVTSLLHSYLHRLCRRRKYSYLTAFVGKTALQKCRIRLAQRAVCRELDG